MQHIQLIYADFGDGLYPKIRQNHTDFSCQGEADRVPGRRRRFASRDMACSMAIFGRQTWQLFSTLLINQLCTSRTTSKKGVSIQSQKDFFIQFSGKTWFEFETWT